MYGKAPLAGIRVWGLDAYRFLGIPNDYSGVIKLHFRVNFQCSKRCPTCRARALQRNIVKRLYFANFDSSADGVGNPSDNAVVDVDATDVERNVS